MFRVWWHLFCWVWHATRLVHILRLQLQQSNMVIFSQIKVLIFIFRFMTLKNTFLEVQPQISLNIAVIIESRPQVWEAVWGERDGFDCRSSLLRMNLSSLLKVLGHLRYSGVLLRGNLLLITDLIWMYRLYRLLLVTWTTSGTFINPQILYLLLLILCSLPCKVKSWIECFGLLPLEHLRFLLSQRVFSRLFNRTTAIAFFYKTRSHFKVQ